MFLVPDSFIEGLVAEDLHIMDVTTEALGIGECKGTIECFPCRNCVVAGVEEASRVFRVAGAGAEIIRGSGSELEPGAVFLRASGTADSLHASYKAAQNVMEYSSGIATRCAAMVKNARRASPDIEVSVTRKHFPGTKLLSLKAAMAGGASIHRLGLSDSILVFDQHRVFTGGSEGFISIVKKISRRFPEKKIAAEAGDYEEAISFVHSGIEVVQCERFDPETLAKFVARAREINPNVKILAAGGVNADNAYDYAATGINAIVTSWVYFGKPEDIKMKFGA
jgi:molybdenum transport protein